MNKLSANRSGETLLATESAPMTIILFLASTLVIIIFYLRLYRIGVVQAIQDGSNGLIHGTLLLNSLLFVGAVYGVMIRFGKMETGNLGLNTEKLPSAVAIGLIMWMSVQMIQGVAGYSLSGTVTIEPSWRTEGGGRDSGY